MSTESTEKKTRAIKCVVVSDSMEKSRVGMIERKVKHPRYGKYLKRSTKIMFHDQENKSKVGDIVIVNSCRPMSASKRFALKEIVGAIKIKG